VRKSVAKYHPEIAFRFKQTRAEKKLTQPEFAELLDITLSTCKALEMGSFAPNIETIRKWHKVFKKTYDWILDGKY
jgi:DNA-binding XRE family transcriptional regulator